MEEFLAGDADYLHFVDSDIEFQGHPVAGKDVVAALEYHGSLSRMHGDAVIGGKYQMSGSDHACAVDVQGKYVQMGECGVQTVCWTGAGWMLIPRSALAADGAPWFRLMAGKTCCPEDVGFCLSAGRHIVLDSDVFLRHGFRGGIIKQEGTMIVSGELSKADRLATIDEELRGIARRLYQLTLAIRVQKKVGDDARVKALEGEAEKVVAVQDHYYEERAAVEKE